MRRWPVLAFALSGVACGFGHEVEQSGDYAAEPGTYVTDSAPYPLESLLILEEDVAIGQTRLYLFSGDLRHADLGLEDLGRIEARFGGFQMAFDPPREKVDGSKVHGRSRPLQAQVGDRELTLLRLDNEGLQDSGASKYLTSVFSTEYELAAYFGVLDDGEAMALGRIEIERRGIDFEPGLPEPELQVRLEDDEFALEYTEGGDYVEIELGQVIMGRGEDAAAVDALVRTFLGPEASYEVSPPLLTDVTGQGCWSRDNALTARLTQIERRYQRRDTGDWAVIHRRTDAIDIGTDTWTAFVGDPHPSAYCSDFE